MSPSRSLFFLPALAGAILLSVACVDSTAPGTVAQKPTIEAANGFPLSSRNAPPPGKGLISGVPATCDNNTTVLATTIPGGLPGIGPVWFDDGTHAVGQHSTLVFEGQVLFEGYWGKSDAKPTITCVADVPFQDGFAQLTVQIRIQH